MSIESDGVGVSNNHNSGTAHNHGDQDSRVEKQATYTGRDLTATDGGDDSGASEIGPSTRRYLGFAALVAIVTGINTTFSLLAPVLPTETEKRHISPFLTGIVFAAYSVGTCLTSPLFGRLSQRRWISKRLLLTLGLVISALASAGFGFCGLVPRSSPRTFTALILFFRVLHGIGAAAVDVSSMVIVTQFYRGSGNFGTALGLLESSIAVGWMVGPICGGFLSAWKGFSAPFLAAAIFAVAVTPLVVVLPPDEPEEPVVASEGRQHTKMMEVLGKVDIVILLLATIIVAAAVTFLDVTLAPFLADVEGFNAAQIGSCFTVIAAAYAIATTPAGWLSDRTSPIVVIFIGLLLNLVPFALLGPSPLVKRLLATDLGAWHVWVSLSIVGVGCALGLVPNLPACLNAADKAGLPRRGTEDLVAGLISAAFNLGAGAGPVIGGALDSALGFEWATTAYGFGLVGTSGLLLVGLLWAGHRRSATERDRVGVSESLLESSHADVV